MRSFRSGTVKKLVDTNVILRYLLKDNEVLFKKASSLLEKVKVGEEAVVIPESVLAECVYVLLRIYKVERQIVQKSSKDYSHIKGWQPGQERNDIRHNVIRTNPVEHR